VPKPIIIRLPRGLSPDDKRTAICEALKQAAEDIAGFIEGEMARHALAEFELHGGTSLDELKKELGIC
jgi:hypothetical protein